MVDINCDMGEGMANDAMMMPFISSANIACGYHAGDNATMEKTINLCLEHAVAIGAHPSLPDRENFGRTEMDISPYVVVHHIQNQLEVISTFCWEQRAILHHVKPHGALYNMAARNQELAAAIAIAVYNFDKSLILYGLSGSFLISEGEKAGLKTASEVFADRSYQPNGMLTSRSRPDAMITDAVVAVEQVIKMLLQQKVTTTNGTDIDIKADTVCIHGDGPHAVEIASHLHQSLTAHAIAIGAI